MKDKKFTSHQKKGNILRADLCHFSDAYIVVKGTITVTAPDNAKRNEMLHLKTMYNLSTAFQRLIMY